MRVETKVTFLHYRHEEVLHTLHTDHVPRTGEYVKLPRDRAWLIVESVQHTITDQLHEVEVTLMEPEG